MITCLKLYCYNLCIIVTLWWKPSILQTLLIWSSGSHSLKYQRSVLLEWNYKKIRKLDLKKVLSFLPYLESVFRSFFPFFFQLKLGAGSPVAWQNRTAIPPDFTLWLCGGFVISGGSKIDLVFNILPSSECLFRPDNRFL